MRLLIVLVLSCVFLACGTITPAIKEATDVIACRYAAYVSRDEALKPDEQALRREMAENLRHQVGLTGACPDYGR